MSKKDTHPTWMTLEEVAEYLRLSRSKLYDLAQDVPESPAGGGSSGLRSTSGCFGSVRVPVKRATMTEASRRRSAQGAAA